MKDILPNTPSALLRLALADLRKVEAASNKYAVNMHYWHESRVTEIIKGSTKCFVCLAGSVMAMTLEQDASQNTYPDSYDKEIETKLLALDSFRGGLMQEACSLLGVDFSNILLQNIIHPTRKAPPQYSKNLEEFHAYFQELANVFEAAGC